MLLNIPFLLSGLTTASVLFILYLAYKKIQLEKRLRDHGKKADALILSIEEEYKYLILNLRIEPQDFPAFEAKQRVDRWAHDPFHVGDRVSVLFDPQHPTDFTLEYPFGEKTKKVS